jgi:outer membrane protein OmpU
MKHTLLATTAFVAMTGAAAAELTISGSGRLGLVTTEGTAAKTTAAKAGSWTATEEDTAVALDAAYPTFSANTTHNTLIARVGITNAGATANATDDADVAAMLATKGAIEAAIAGNSAATEAEQAAMALDLAAVNHLISNASGTAGSTTKAVADSTAAANRFRITFKGSGETDGGIAYGISGRAEQSNASTLGSQYISGAFGKISMGDLDGADEVAAGGGVAGVGLTGLLDTNDIAYQSSDHNLGYEFSTSGMTFTYSQDTTVTTGSNSAMGLKYSGAMGGATVSIGLGQSKVGDATQSTMSASVTSGGLTIKAYSSSNDNGPSDKKVDQVASGAVTPGTKSLWVQGSALVANNDTDQTALSISYAMDAISVTAFTKTVSTSGAVDKDYSGFGFAYDMGGASLKAGVVDNNDQQLVDFGVSFSF